MAKEKLIPPGIQGKNVDLQEEQKLEDRRAAGDLFKLAVERLLHPQQWKQLSGSGTASFDVIGPGNEPEKAITDRAIREGDFIRIDIPGPGTGKGDGYDWVRVDKIVIEDKGEEQYAGIKLVPSDNPMNDEPAAAHFFDRNSSSTLIVELKGQIVSAYYHGRNEKINNETGSVADNIRNTIVAAGALLGLSEVQWKKLIRGFLDGND